MLTGEVPTGTMIRVTYRASEYVEGRTIVGEVQRCSFEDFEDQDIPRIWYYEIVYWDARTGRGQTDIASTYVAEDISVNCEPVRVGEPVTVETCKAGALVWLDWRQEVFMVMRDSYRVGVYLSDWFGDERTPHPRDRFFLMAGLS